MTSPDRLAALAALVAAGAKTGESTPLAPVLSRTGAEVPAGGSTPVLLIRDGVALSYTEGTLLRYAQASAGDTVLVNAKQAARLTALGVAVDPDTDLDELEDELEDGLATDDQLAGMPAADLVAYVAQHPAERERVHALEQAGKARKTVLAATEPTPEADLDAELEQAAREDDEDELGPQ